MAPGVRQSLSLRLADSIYEWRWRLWIAVPTCAALVVLSMTDIVRILLGAVLAALVFVPFILRIVGNFVDGYRGH